MDPQLILLSFLSYVGYNTWMSQPICFLLWLFSPDRLWSWHFCPWLMLSAVPGWLEPSVPSGWRWAGLLKPSFVIYWMWPMVRQHIRHQHLGTSYWYGALWCMYLLTRYQRWSYRLLIILSQVQYPDPCLQRLHWSEPMVHQRCIADLSAVVPQLAPKKLAEVVIDVVIWQYVQDDRFQDISMGACPGMDAYQLLQRETSQLCSKWAQSKRSPASLWRPTY